MMQQALRAIHALEFWTILSLLFFAGFFIGMLVWAFRQPRQRLQEIGRLPLDDNERTGDQP